MRRRSFFWGLVWFGLIAGPFPAARAQICASTTTRPDQSWPDYQVIIWQDQTPQRLAGLARLGVTAGRVFGARGPLDPATIPEQIAPFRALNWRWYIENIATDFYAPYHRWAPDRPVTWLFDEIKRLHHEAPADITAFTRTPSLSDPAWLSKIAGRLRQHVQAYAPYKPLYYSLADEAGIADLAAAWDFDFAPASLAGMRVWLKQGYGTLAALNREWGTRFPTWNSVMPMTTDAALNQPDENFSRWADFKAWMDVAFARALRTGTDAVHTADPKAHTALEGAQPPGWGGYDYSRLAKAVDVLEMYDADNNVEIARSLAPNLITLSTSSVADPQQIHSIWHELLLGGRGLILWDENDSFVDEDGEPTQLGHELAELTAELRSGIAAQLISSTRVVDPVAILYSPESFRTQWLLDRKAEGQPWAERGSETEDLDDNQVRATTRRFAGMLTHLGVQPRWLTREMIEQGVLQNDHIRVLMLPHAIALSPGETQQIRAFAAADGVVLADSEPGLFDAHGRRLDRSPLADLTGAERPIALVRALQHNPELNDPAPLAQLREILETSEVMPRFTLSTLSGSLATGVDVRAFRNGDVTIIGLQPDWEADNDGASKDVILSFKRPVYVHDMWRSGRPQRAAQISLTLDRVTPALLAIAPAPLPELAVSGPTRARVRTDVAFTIAQLGVSPLASRILHMEATAPNGSVVTADTANLALCRATVTWHLSLTPDDLIGDWTIRIVDVLSGQRLEHKLTVLGVEKPPHR